jgi:hypothetical protein
MFPMRFDATNPCSTWPPAIARWPRLVRLVVCNWLLGFVASAVFTVLVIGLDVAGIGHLVTHVEGGWLAALLFFFLNGIVFAGVQVGVVVMTMPDDR